MSREGRRIEIEGIVQGVGFRPWVYHLAKKEGLAGRVRNDSRGVTIDAFGEDASLDVFVDELMYHAPPAAEVDKLTWEPIPLEPVETFAIVESEVGHETQVSIPPDLATCPDCVREIFDPTDRRYRYPFTNCTNCGPRYTIVSGVPYDRPATTMRDFPMCPACRAEYDDPSNRRFHAQPNACPSCGPRLRAVTSRGDALDASDEIQLAGRAIRAQLIIAVKGLGGFHLACDATSSGAVIRLRERKHRDEKPFAVMTASMEQAEKLAHLTDVERNLLLSPERPIVLAQQRDDSPLAQEVAPDNRLVGLMLPYTPLHHLLLKEAGRPLVMTSGNLSEEPIIFDNIEAISKLGPVADVLLLHNREIESRADDSVVRAINGSPTVLRRARGYVPRPVRLAAPVDRPILACGAHLKNTFCLASGDSAYLGPHIGDLENLETVAVFEQSIEKLKRFFAIEPEIIAHDLHPEYLSTRFALAQKGMLRIGVQHHHAHIASCMAENRVEGPVIGVAFDGTGYGTDGTLWGGEIAIADYELFERVATLRPIRLAGGDVAIREVWRLALAALDDAFEGDAPLDKLPLFDSVPSAEIAVVRKMIAAGFNAPLAHGAGRYFDVIGALVSGRAKTSFEGQAAMFCNFAADPSERGTYEVGVHEQHDPWQLDLRPVMRGAVRDLIAGRSGATVAARFHNTLARATAEMVRSTADRTARLPVVISGGCFQNDLLADRLAAALSPDFRLYFHHRVPPGDGGIALGQALVADAMARRGSRPPSTNRSE